MNRFNLLECTLRDGGYITNWMFSESMIKSTISTLAEANFDLIEVGYLYNKPYVDGSTQFQAIEQIAEFLPKERKNTLFLAMADVQQFLPKDLTPYTGASVDGIRVVFYRHQVEEALIMCKAVRDMGYKLFVQPMVTIDYSLTNYARLMDRVAKIDPYAVSIVDSFGYMTKSDFRSYFKVLDNILPANVAIGFHSHNNMNLSFVTGQDILEYVTARNLIIDASLYGMGRGAGNLQTELIANYYNSKFGNKYDVLKIIDLISEHIMPIYKKTNWGYSPYFFLTGLYHCHPNYVTYLLQEHEVSVSEFREYLDTIPKEMYLKCRKPYVLEMYDKFKSSSKEALHSQGQ